MRNGVTLIFPEECGWQKDLPQMPRRSEGQQQPTILIQYKHKTTLMNHQPRDPHGRYDKKPNYAGYILTGLALLTTAYYLLFTDRTYAAPCTSNCPISIEEMAHAIVEEMGKRPIDTSSTTVRSMENVKTYYLGDSETYAKWIEYLDNHVAELERKVGEPKTVLRYVCRENGVMDESCPKILYGMAWQESVFGKYMTGDGGKSKGWYHIMHYHNVPVSCSHNLECAADWTLKRMIRFGFGENKRKTEEAIMRHNGTPNTPTTKNYLALVLNKAKLWDR